MLNMSLKGIASREIDAKADLIREVSRKIHDNPELGHQEHEASKLMASGLGAERAGIRGRDGDIGPGHLLQGDVQGEVRGADDRRPG